MPDFSEQYLRDKLTRYSPLFLAYLAQISALCQQADEDTQDAVPEENRAIHRGTTKWRLTSAIPQKLHLAFSGDYPTLTYVKLPWITKTGVHPGNKLEDMIIFPVATPSIGDTDSITNVTLKGTTLLNTEHLPDSSQLFGLEDEYKCIDYKVGDTIAFMVFVTSEKRHPETGLKEYIVTDVRLAIPSPDFKQGYLANVDLKAFFEGQLPAHMPFNPKTVSLFDISIKDPEEGEIE